MDEAFGRGRLGVDPGPAAQKEQEHVLIGLLAHLRSRVLSGFQVLQALLHGCWQPVQNVREDAPLTTNPLQPPQNPWGNLALPQA